MVFTASIGGYRPSRASLTRAALIFSGPLVGLKWACGLDAISTAAAQDLRLRKIGRVLRTRAKTRPSSKEAVFLSTYGCIATCNRKTRIADGVSTVRSIVALTSSNCVSVG